MSVLSELLDCLVLKIMAWFQFCSCDSVDFNPECCKLSARMVARDGQDRFRTSCSKALSILAVKLILILFDLVVLVLPRWLI